MVPLYRWVSTLRATELLWDNLLFTVRSPGLPGADLIEQWSMKKFIHRYLHPENKGKKSFICIVEFNLTGYEYVNQEKSLNFSDWILCYCEPFHDNIKNQRNINQFLYLWNLNHCKVNLTWICQCSLFMNIFNTESTTLFQQSWFPS